MQKFFASLLKMMGATAALMAVAAMAAAEPEAEKTATPAKSANSQTAEDVIVTVNEQKLTRAEYDRETADIAKMLEKRGVTPEQFSQLLKTLQPQIVDGLVTRMLINQACKEKNIQVSDEEVAAKIAKFEKNLPKSMTLEMVLKQSGLTREMFENDVREQLKLEKLLEIGQASDAQIRAYYDENKARFFEKPEMVHARHILIAVKPEDKPEDKQAKRKKAEKILADLKKNPADFAKLAEEHSDCPSKASGGDLGEFRRGQMVKEFEDVAFRLKPDEISDIVETKFGYHIIQTLSHDEPRTMEFEEVRERISETLRGREIQEKAEAFLQDKRRNAKISYAAGFEPRAEQEISIPAEGAAGQADAKGESKSEAAADKTSPKGDATEK